MNNYYWILVVLISLLPIHTEAYEVNGSAQYISEFRYFVSEAQFNDQFNGFQSSIILQPTFRIQSVSKMNQFMFIAFFRLDGRDNNRTYTDIRESYWRHIYNDWSLLVGIDRVFWGVTESNHLIDIINQADLIDNIDAVEKMGQPMIKLSVQKEWGDLRLLIMPQFRERSYPSMQGRLRPQSLVDQEAIYNNSDGQNHVDVALRYSHYIRDCDFGIYYFSGIGREPRLLQNAAADRLIAYYDLINQIAVDVQFTNESWLWKFESYGRSQNNDGFIAALGGFEYTYYQINRRSADLGFLMEYSYDGRNNDRNDAPPTLFDNDLFLAARLVMNNTQDSEMLMGLVIDLDNQASIFTIEAKHRIGNSWKIELASKWFLHTQNDIVLSPLKKDSFIKIRISKYF